MSKNAVRDIFEDRLLNEKEAAKFLGLAPISLRMQRCQGVNPNGLVFIPYVKIGKSVRYSLADLREVIKAHRVTG